MIKKEKYFYDKNQRIELIGKFVNGKFKKGNIWYKLENGKLIKDYEEIGKFVNNELNDVNGKEITYKLENGKLVIHYEEIGKFVNGEFKKGKEIWFKLENGKLVKNFEEIGKFVKGELNEKKKKLCIN